MIVCQKCGKDEFRIASKREGTSIIMAIVCDACDEVLERFPPDDLSIMRRLKLIKGGKTE